MFAPMLAVASAQIPASPSASAGRVPSLSAVPEAAAASKQAARARQLLAGGTDPRVPLRDLDGLCAAAGILIDRRQLRGAAGGIEATLTPLDGDRFGVVVDPEPPGGWGRIGHPAVAADLERQRFRFRVAHELGHTLFYHRSGQRPRRRFAVTPREEAFCDRFARALLLPDAAVAECSASPAEVVRVQREYDVSLETCVRAFAEVHGERFFGLLVSKGASAPFVRPQWVSPAELPARWWAADWLQRALPHGSTSDRSGLIGSGRKAMRCLWRALPHRGQLLITGTPAS